MLSLHKLTAGDGYTYLTRHIAGGDVQRERGQDATDYYTAEGNPPGRWAGRGLATLDLRTREVTEQAMRNLFGLGIHPEAERIKKEYLAEHLREDLTPAHAKKVQQAADKAAELGGPFRSYEPPEHFQKRVDQRLDAIREETGREPTEADAKRAMVLEARAQRAAVAGYDLVFSPVKSIALLWALHPDPQVRAGIRQAHQEAMASALDMLETHAAFTRTGRNGIAQIATRGMVAVAFDHYDSRDGDPNLHTHYVVSNKVQGVDGIWRSLDARALFRMTVAASEHYNTALETIVSTRFGIGFSPREDTPDGKQPVREVTGIPLTMIDHYSSRRTALEARYAELVRTYRREHGYDPSRKAAYQLARQATLETRQHKKQPRSLAAMRGTWHASLLATFGPAGVRAITDAVPARPQTIGAETLNIGALAAKVTATVEESRSTWTRWNLHAEAERLLRAEHRFNSLDEQKRTVALVVQEATSDRHAVRVNAPPLTNEPKQLRRNDGESVFTQHAAERYTSARILTAEQRLLHAAQHEFVPTMDPQIAHILLAGVERESGRTLDPGQRELAIRFACHPARITVGLGPAGSGKTTAMTAFTALTREAGHRVIPLATSSASAAVLARQLGVPAENLHKFVYEHLDGYHADRLRSGSRVPVALQHLQVRAGDVILVDEAGLAGTPNLDRLLTIAREHQTRIVLLGDYRQLGAIESGGALRLLAHDAGAIELTTLYRFANPAEAAATLKLRVGDASALDFYTENHRIHTGSRDGMTEAAYQGWRTDMLAGKKTILTAATGIDTTRLSAQAREDRVAAGQVEVDGVELRDGNLAGVGDWIITRDNNRKLLTHGGRDFVKNGDGWTVLARHDDGALTVEHDKHHGRLTLPAEYVREHVQLLYASTVIRTQGLTVETAHPLITEEMTREELYVALTRAQFHTTLYVATHDILPLDEDERTDYPRNDPRAYAGMEILLRIINTEGAELSATEAMRESQRLAGSLATLAPYFQHTLEIVSRPGYHRLVHDTFDDELAQAVTDSPTWASLRRTLIAAEQAGHHGDFLLKQAADRENLTGVSDPAERLDLRINTYLDKRPTGTVTDESGQPKWLTIPARSHTNLDPELHSYLRTLGDLTEMRVQELQQLAAKEQPVWAADLLVDRIAIVAAFRDQYQITDADPTQPLGPFIPAESADHHTYRQALRALSPTSEGEDDAQSASRRRPSPHSSNSKRAAALHASRKRDLDSELLVQRDHSLSPTAQRDTASVHYPAQVEHQLGH
ncbi:MAG TPA: MobF family relaxase [Actinocrinis sp.]|uniref:MobF family relaxase n=1 Tax=Actinocrinis sp. TaxID=1920516 RepID=UPI002DDDADE2|nr:MobF family relaxase [Actinocrinis sp.]HEV2347019.1 MobF family relaxase [Actinocrinis sp.]